MFLLSTLLVGYSRISECSSWDRASHVHVPFGPRGRVVSCASNGRLRIPSVFENRSSLRMHLSPLEYASLTMICTVKESFWNIAFGMEPSNDMTRYRKTWLAIERHGSLSKDVARYRKIWLAIERHGSANEPRDASTSSNRSLTVNTIMSAHAHQAIASIRNNR
jgi:DNA-binding transcriptional ArsR family regulator